MCVRVFVLLLCLLSVQGGRLFAVVRGIDSLARNEKCAVVTGVVYDVQGETIAGVNIIEKGTMNGVTTDREGKFSLEVDLHGTLIWVSIAGKRDPDQRSMQIYLKREFPFPDRSLPRSSFLFQ